MHILRSSREMSEKSVYGRCDRRSSCSTYFDIGSRWSDPVWLSPAEASGFALGNVTVNQTVVPTPSVLSRLMMPFIIDSIKDLQILRPRPLPPYFRAVLASA